MLPTFPSPMRPNTSTAHVIAEYLRAMIEDGDPALLAAVLGDIARARGMTEIAKASGIGREDLYKALRPGAQPRFDTIARVCAASSVVTFTPAVARRRLFRGRAALGRDVHDGAQRTTMYAPRKMKVVGRSPLPSARFARRTAWQANAGTADARPRESASRSAND